MNPYISKVISVSRFPMICGVVMIHSQIFERTNVSLFFGEMYGRICVPFFYLISGFLFFHGYKSLLGSYKEKLGKRVRSWLIPYILWNLIAYLIYTFITGDMVPSQILESFTVVSGKSGHSPADGPLWFLRTLMILSIISPLLYLINVKKYISWLSPILMMAWLLDAPGVKSGTIIGLLWFNLGAWFQLSNMERFVRKPSMKIAYSTLALYAILAFVEINCNMLTVIWYHKLVLVVGMLVFFVLPVFRVNSLFEVMGGVSFFMYCFHEMVIRCIQISCQLPFPDSVNYVIVVVSTIVICVLAYHLLRKICPKVLSTLIGSR